MAVLPFGVPHGFQVGNLFMITLLYKISPTITLPLLKIFGYPTKKLGISLLFKAYSVLKLLIKLFKLLSS
jgi:hypothetical protein